MQLAPVHPEPVLPEYYSSLMDTDTKFAIAGAACELVAEHGYTPCLATVTGSRLRGLDHATSDTDVLVFVTDDCRGGAGRKNLQHTVEALKKAGGLLHDVEGQVRPVNELFTTCSTSLPYMETLYSPFLLADPVMTQWVATFRPNLIEFTAHAQRFALHVAARGAKTNSAQTIDKRLRNVVAAYSFAHSLNPLADRTAFAPATPTACRAADWLEDSLHCTSTDHDPQVVAHVADLLRGW